MITLKKYTIHSKHEHGHHLPFKSVKIKQRQTKSVFVRTFCFTGWKLLGDVLVAHTRVTPRSSLVHQPQFETLGIPPAPMLVQHTQLEHEGVATAEETQEAFFGWRKRVQVLQCARVAYARACHLAPWEANGYASQITSTFSKHPFP